MPPHNVLRERIFQIRNRVEFEATCLEVFRMQHDAVPVYRKFCDMLGVKPDEVTEIEAIPFLPIETFRSHQVLRTGMTPSLIFESSGTTAAQTSKHFVADPAIYERSLSTCFREQLTDPASCHLFALLPSYLDRPSSSLVYMVEHLLKQNPNQRGGFYNWELDRLVMDLKMALSSHLPIFLIGVTFALLDLARRFPMDLSEVIIIETGGMKGQGPELTREELHQELNHRLHPKAILSEYGMTELLSQAWMQEDGHFHCPPWMDILTRDLTDPLKWIHSGTGAINVIDLANLDSCAFVATSDLGKKHADGSFEVLGRVDSSEVRGCNLMYTGS